MSHMPEFIAPQRFTDAGAALEQVERIYKSGLKHLRDAMQDFVAGEDMPGRVRACNSAATARARRSSAPNEKSSS